MVPRPAAEGAARGFFRSLTRGKRTGAVSADPSLVWGENHGRNSQLVPRLCRRAAAFQHPGDDRRHSARRHHRRAARVGRRQRRGDPAAAHFLDVADVGDHHVVLHLLGRAVRRRHHVHPLQHSGRALVGRDHFRRPPDGPARQGRRGVDRGLHLVVRRRAVRGHRHYAGGAAGGEVCAPVRPCRKSSRFISSPFAASSA